jgi:ABC-type transport system substrate-binding protein
VTALDAEDDSEAISRPGLVSPPPATGSRRPCRAGAVLGQAFGRRRKTKPRLARFATALVDATDELSAPDDRTVRFHLKRPFPHLPEALAGPGGNVPAIMPERLAAESPYKPVGEIVGSGPYRFLKDEHVSGARAVFERFAEYQPKAGGPVGFTAGRKSWRRSCFWRSVIEPGKAPALAVQPARLDLYMLYAA